MTHIQDCNDEDGDNNNMLNVNFAPINSNLQNFININTEVETEIKNSKSKTKKIPANHGKSINTTSTYHKIASGNWYRYIKILDSLLNTVCDDDCY